MGETHGGTKHQILAIDLFAKVFSTLARRPKAQGRWVTFGRRLIMAVIARRCRDDAEVRSIVRNGCRRWKYAIFFPLGDLVLYPAVHKVRDGRNQGRECPRLRLRREVVFQGRVNKS